MHAATHIPVEAELLLAAGQALCVIDFGQQETLDRYDEVIEIARAEGLPFFRAAEKARVPITTPMVAMLAQVYLFHWFENGAEAFLTLAEHVNRLQTPNAGFEQNVLVCTLAALKQFSLESATGNPQMREETWAPTGVQLLNLARLLEDNDCLEPARECALVAADLLGRASHERRARAAELALQLMERSGKKVLLRCTPIAKYPPPTRPTIPPNVLLNVVLHIVEDTFLGFLSAPRNEGGIRNEENFNEVVREMLQDRDFVLKQTVGFEYQAEGGLVLKVPMQHVEMRFSPALLRRIDVELGYIGMPTLSYFPFLMDLLIQIMENKKRLQHWRDQYLHNWFVLRAAEPYREGAFFNEGVVFVQHAGSVVLVTIGEREDDIDEWTQYGRFAETAREFLRKAKAQLV